MKKNITLLAVLLLFGSVSSGQKLVKTYYDYQNTRVHEVYYVNAKGEKDGKYTEYAENGIITGQSTFHNGLANGVVTIYNTETGRQILFKRETYKEGVKDGPATYYDAVNDPSIPTASGSYKNDAKEGLWTFIKPVGAQDYNYPDPEIPQQAWSGCNYIKYTETYNNDEKVKTNGQFSQTFYPSGKIYLQGTYYNDNPLEIFIFYPNGKLFTYLKVDSAGNKIFSGQWKYPGGSKDSLQVYMLQQKSEQKQAQQADEMARQQQAQEAMRKEQTKSMEFRSHKHKADSLFKAKNYDMAKGEYEYIQQNIESGIWNVPTNVSRAASDSLHGMIFRCETMQ